MLVTVHKWGGQIVNLPPPHLTKINLNFFILNRLIWKFQDRLSSIWNAQIRGFRSIREFSGGLVLQFWPYVDIFWSDFGEHFWNWDLTMIPKKLLPDDSYPIGNIQVSEGITTSNNIVLKHFLTFWGTINVFSIKSRMVPQAYIHDCVVVL